MIGMNIYVDLDRSVERLVSVFADDILSARKSLPKAGDIFYNTLYNSLFMIESGC